MEEVDNGDCLLVEVVPEGVGGVAVVNEHLIHAHHRNRSTLRQQHLLLLRMGTELHRVHSESSVSITIIVYEEDEEDGSLVGLGGVGVLEGDSVVLRSRRRALQQDEVGQGREVGRVFVFVEYVQSLLLLDLLVIVASLLDDFSVFLNGLASKAGSPHRHEGPTEGAKGVVVGDTTTDRKSVV